jgi:4-hydroxy-3-methylbut-2-enyl diphosphate reductase
MRIILAKRAGFCFGVKRAMDIAFDMARKGQGGVYTLGPIIHNPQVVEKLDKAGVEAVKNMSNLKKMDARAVIIRTHGIPKDEMENLVKDGYEIIDTTCPFVKNAQHYAKLLKQEGYKVVILGDREHPEVKGLMSFAGKDALVVNDVAEYPPIKGKVGIVVQTTQQVENLKRLLSVAVEHSKELKVYNTICNSTALRLKETEEMAGKADVMVIVGGKNSANTTQLAKLCASLSVPTYHIETGEELRDEWFTAAETVGITAGASTPEWIINEVHERIKHIGGKGC